jgi:hypothetical protein
MKFSVKKEDKQRVGIVFVNIKYNSNWILNKLNKMNLEKYYPFLENQVYMF